MAYCLCTFMLIERVQWCNRFIPAADGTLRGPDNYGKLHHMGISLQVHMGISLQVHQLSFDTMIRYYKFTWGFHLLFVDTVIKWGFDYKFTNYKFGKPLELLKNILSEG